MGVITIEPKEILIDGLRKEMLKSLAKTLHSQFIFKQLGNGEELDARLAKLKQKISGLKRAIEYI